jgi:hypothetical protein
MVKIIRIGLLATAAALMAVVADWVVRKIVGNP